MSAYDYDTLEFHTKERPGTQFRSLAHIPMHLVGQAVRMSVERLQDDNATQPEEEAIEFYLLNHAMAEVQKRVAPDQPLGKYLPVVENYHRMLSRLGYRLFNYLTLITLREARHWSSGSAIMGLQGDEKLKEWAAKIPKGSAEEYLYDNMLEYTFGEWLDLLDQIYNSLHWGGSYGGPLWGSVTRCLSSLVKGESSIEMMLDVGYTLAHNTGPIFNKGFHYKHNDGKSAILRILDCQRAGEIPALVKAQASPHVGPSHVGLLKQIESVGLLQAREFVCWELVEQLGALQSYPHDKQQVAMKWAGSDEYTELLKSITGKAAEAQAKQAAEKAEAEKNQFEVVPGVFIQKSHPVRAA